ncbi:MAG: hypothetical protein DME09_14485 [Candidatus Rokuibacteriota bacterium]|nr:MAG: hypothetical protein DME09_14485 [Candidatus Rokubacteria bacterium]
MTRDPAAPRVVDVFAHRGRFFGVLQGTERSQTGVMTIAPGADAGPEEQHEGDQIIYGVGGRPSCAPTRASAGRDRGALSRFPGAVRHHVRTPGTMPLFLLTVYAPPEY